MNKTIISILLLATALTASTAFAQTPRKTMRLVDIFDAGQPQTVILKLYDADADVICYLLTPENAGKQVVDGKLVYEGNSIGSISCVKRMTYVIPVNSESEIKR